MDNSQNLAVFADRLVSLIVRHASTADWLAVEKYEAQLRECRMRLAQTQTPGF